MFRVAVLTCALFLLNGTAPVSAAGIDTSGFVLTNTQWSVDLDDAHEYVLVGERVADGYCAYNYPEVVVTDENVWHYTRVIGVDRETCRQLLQDGTSTTGPTEPSGPGYAHAALVDLSTSSAPASPDSAGGQKRGVHVVQWVDPFRLAVNWVRNTTTFVYDYTCADSGTTAGAFDWFWESGWYKKSSSTTHSQDPLCEWWQGETKATFQNDTFCALSTTHAVYDYVRVKGWYNGVVGFTRSTYVDGGCYDMLSMQFSVEVTRL
jgi:hypothetical protein